MLARGIQTVLVIDDSQVVLDVTEAMLTRLGYQVITAPSGEQALELIEDWPDLQIDLALIDVILNGMSGPDVAKKILERMPGVPIIFMSGFPEHRSFLATQGQVVLRKPFTSVVLNQVIRQVLKAPAPAAPLTSAAGGSEA